MSTIDRQKKTIAFGVNSYTVKYQLQNDRTLLMDRTVHQPAAAVQIDVFGLCWAFSTATIPPGMVWFERHGNLIPVVGNIAVFVPPFSVMKWHLSPGPFRYESIFFAVEPPPFLPKEPVIFAVEDTRCPTTLAQVLAMIGRAEHLIPIGKEEVPCSIARKTRTMIEQTYAEDVSFAEIAQRLNLSHAVMTRNFRRCYGLPPVVFRNKIRVMDAQRLMLVNQLPVAMAAEAVGFADLRQFNRAFKKESNTTPSHFCTPGAAAGRPRALTD